MTSNRRDHLVATALALFRQYGFHATGIDRILAESGVAKKTLYNHFSSKDELIVAALQLRDQQFLQVLSADIERLQVKQKGDPRWYRLLAFFDALQERLESDNFRGCTFINASAEYPDQDSPIRQVCRSHKQLVIDQLQQLLDELPVPQAEGVARQMALLVEGAIVTAQAGGDAQAGLLAKSMAQKLLERA